MIDRANSRLASAIVPGIPIDSSKTEGVGTSPFQRFSRRQHALSGFDDGVVDELAVELDGGEAVGFGLGEGVDDAGGEGDFGGRGRKDGIDRLDLAGVDGHLALETELLGGAGAAREAARVAQVDPDGIEGRFKAGGAGGDDQGRASVLAFDFAPRPGDADVAGEITGAEGEALDACAGGGDVVNALYREGGFHNRNDVNAAGRKAVLRFQPVQQRVGAAQVVWRFHLGQNDACQAGAV